MDNFGDIRVEDHTSAQIHTALEIAKEDLIVFIRVKSDDCLILIALVDNFDFFNLNKLIE